MNISQFDIGLSVLPCGFWLVACLHAFKILLFSRLLAFRSSWPDISISLPAQYIQTVQHLFLMGSQGIQWLVSEQNLYKFLSLCFLNNMDGVNLHHIRVLEASGFSFSKPPPTPHLTPEPPVPPESRADSKPPVTSLDWCVEYFQSPFQALANTLNICI